VPALNEPPNRNTEPMTAAVENPRRRQRAEKKAPGRSMSWRAGLKSKRRTSSNAEEATLQGTRTESLAAHSAARMNVFTGTGTSKSGTKAHRAQSESGRERRTAVKKRSQIENVKSSERKLWFLPLNRDAATCNEYRN
jgi:anti-sigma factor RsiW